MYRRSSITTMMNTEYVRCVGRIMFQVPGESLLRLPMFCIVYNEHIIVTNVCGYHDVI